MAQPIMSFKKILRGREYGLSHSVFLESFDQKTMWFNLYSILKKVWYRDDMVQPTLSF